jgi:hypothetical protein
MEEYCYCSEYSDEHYDDDDQQDEEREKNVRHKFILNELRKRNPVSSYLLVE